MIVYDCPSCSHLRVVPLHRTILDVSSGFFKVVRCEPHAAGHLDRFQEEFEAARSSTD